MRRRTNRKGIGHMSKLSSIPMFIAWPYFVCHNLWLRYNCSGHLHLQQQVPALWLALLQRDLWVRLGRRQDQIATRDNVTGRNSHRAFRLPLTVTMKVTMIVTITITVTVIDHHRDCHRSWQ